MRYFVTIGGREMEVELGEDGVRIDGEEVPADLVEMDGTEVHSLILGGKSHRILAASEGGGEWRLLLSGRQIRVEVLDERTRAIRKVTESKEVRGGPKALRAPMPGMVVKLEAKKGDVVAAGQGLVIVEAMKMENELKSTGKGRISRILVEPGQTVAKDQVLVEFEVLSGELEKGAVE